MYFVTKKTDQYDITVDPTPFLNTYLGVVYLSQYFSIEGFKSREKPLKP
jgi:hypothetical protein